MMIIVEFKKIIIIMKNKNENWKYYITENNALLCF